MKIKEVFYTLQGEGAHAGRPAVFCRFSGCNLWTGHERDRASAVCTWCDTDFIGGTRMSLDTVTAEIVNQWPGGGDPWVVFTGGEPLLQLTANLVDKMHDAGFGVSVETNGTRVPPPGIDWLCVSPKASAPLKCLQGNELKLVWPQPLDPTDYLHLDFERFSLQPLDGTPGSVEAAVAYCLAHPQWRLSLQTHKIVGIR